MIDAYARVSLVRIVILNVEARVVMGLLQDGASEKSENESHSKRRLL